MTEQTKTPPNFRNIEFNSCSDCKYYTYNYRLEEGFCTKYDYEVSANTYQVCDDWSDDK